MGIRLDWEIEAEQARIQRAGEDPETARKRRTARLRLLLFAVLVIFIFGGIAALIVWRLQAVDEQIAQLLRNTVDAEVTALRIGDENAFLGAQRSASDEWLQEQDQVFDDYQQRKLTQDIQLTGQISDLTVDDMRARVKVQEIIDGVPYTQVWFYWRYDDGWRHVPPDYTFWGDVQTFQGQGVSVRYQTVDQDVATVIGDRIQSWLQTVCAALTCDGLPEISVEIVPDEALAVSWSASNPWSLQVPSPYIGRARSDMPFDQVLQYDAATLLAERLAASTSPNIQPNFPADASYLRQAAIAWLAARFMQLQSNAYVIESLTQNYGDAAVGRLLQLIQADSDVRILAEAAGVPSIDQTMLDWRDFLTWRLTTEDTLIRNGDEGHFLNLYDTGDETVRNLAYQRFGTPPSDLPKMVVSVVNDTGPDGTPILRALVQTGSEGSVVQEEVLFRLVDGVWRRAN
jgi:hypothetical protein